MFSRLGNVHNRAERIMINDIVVSQAIILTSISSEYFSAYNVY